MILVTKLLLAHLLGDFVLQPRSWVDIKEQKKFRAWQLYAHTAIHGLLIMLLVSDIRFFIPTLIIILSHGIIDGAKVILQKPATKPLWFIIDQLLHLAVILTAWYIYESPDLNFEIINDPNILLSITAVVFITLPASIIIKTLISQWTPDLGVTTASLQNAGKFIGILERFFVLAFVLTNNWEAIGFLIAAKSIFRFGDLKDSNDLKLTEYVLIGTLLSFGIAIATGLLLSNLWSQGSAD